MSKRISLGLFSKKCLGILCATLLLAAWGIQPAFAKPIKFRMVSHVPPTSHMAWEVKEIVGGINKEFEGKFFIDWIGGPEVVPGLQIFESVRTGFVDMGLTAGGYYEGSIPVASALAYSNLTHEEIMETEAFNALRETHEKAGVFFLWEGTMPGDHYYIWLKKKIDKPSDLKGLKIRVWPTVKKWVHGLGAAPIMLPMPEIYTAAERGVIDGFVKGTAGAVTSFHFQEVIDYIVMPGAYRSCANYLANPKSWNKVPKDLQKRIVDFKENVLHPKIREISLKRAESDMKKALDAGIKKIEFSPAESKAFEKVAYDAAWATMLKKDPVLGQKLKDMLVK